MCKTFNNLSSKSHTWELVFKLMWWFFISDEDEEGSESAPKAPRPLSSTDLIKLAEGGEDLVEDLELSDDDDWNSETFNFTNHLYFRNAYDFACTV